MKFFRGRSHTPSHDPYAAFRIPTYRFYTSALIVAMIGMRIQNVAITWEMYERTGNALALGLVGLAQALPTILLALPAGYLADRFSRPKIVVFSMLASMTTALAFAAVSYLEAPVTWVYVLLVLDAGISILGRPARTALMPQLVPLPLFPNAVMWNTSLFQLASVVGPAIGGFVIAYSVTSAYVVNAFGIVVFIVVFVRLPFQATPSALGPRESPLKTLAEGIHFVRQQKVILTTITLDMFAVLLGGAVYLLPIYAQDILDVGARGFGWLRAAPAVGAFCMAVLMAYLPPMRHAGRALLISVAGFGVVTIIFGLSTSFWLSFAMLFFTGVFDNVSVVIRQTVQQLLTPDAMRGRVSAVSSVFISASNELGGLESGLVAYWFGVVFSVVSGGIGTLLVVAGTAVASPELRRFGALEDARPDVGSVQSPPPLPVMQSHPASVQPGDD